MSWPIVELGEVADVNWGDTSVTKKSYTEEGFTAYSATGADGKLPYFDFDRDGVVLSAIGARCGKTWFASGKWSTIKNTIRFWSERPDLDNRFLYWLTANPEFWPRRGAAQPFITIGDARSLKIPLPPLEEQKRIAGILDQADALRRLRTRALDKLNTLGQAIFYEMFGDWCETAALDRLAIKITDGTHQAPEWADEGIPFLFVSNIRGQEIDFASKKFVTDAEYNYLLRRTSLGRGDVLYTCVGSYGNAAVIVDGNPFVFQRHIAHIKPNPAVLDSVFLSYGLESASVRRQADRTATGVAQKTVTLGAIKNFDFPCPPIEQQHKFSSRISSLDNARLQCRSALLTAESLFASLQHRAFRGEL